MRLVLFETTAGRDPVPGLLTERGVVSIASAVRPGHTPQATMQGLIDDFETLRPALERLAREGEARPLAGVRLRPPLPGRSWPASPTTGSTARWRPAR